MSSSNAKRSVDGKAAGAAATSPGVERRVVRSASLSSQIAQQLRQDILLGRLPPGAPVPQGALCEQYGTSRMPVRDALRQLGSEGLVINTAKGRAIVAPLTVDDFEDSFLVEALAHARAARRAAMRATPEDIAHLESINQEMIEAGDRDDAQQVAAANWRFHAEITRLAQSSKLTAILRTASTHIPREYLVVLPDLTESSKRDHRAILNAMKKGDAAKVEKLMNAHVAKAGRQLVEHLQTTGALTVEPT